MNMIIRRVPTLAELIAWTVLVVGMAMSAIAFRGLTGQIEKESRSQFNVECAEIRRLIEIRFNSYADVLFGLRGLFMHSSLVTRSDFHNYVQSLLATGRYRALENINFAQYVDATSMKSETEEVRSGVVAARYSGPRVQASDKRDEYHVVTYVEPLDAGASMVGVNLLAEKWGNAEAFREMRDTGQLTSWGSSNAGDDNLLIGLRLPIYRSGESVDTPEQRRQAIVGSIGIQLSLPVLLTDVLGPHEANSLHFQLRSIGKVRNSNSVARGANERWVFHSRTLPNRENAGPHSFVPSVGTFRSSSQLNFGGEVLELEFDGPVNAFSSTHLAIPYAILFLGIVISVLVFLFIQSLVRSGEKLAAAVRDRTSELERRNVELRSEMNARAELEHEMVDFVESGRRKLGQDLHDDLGQKITAVAFLVESLGRELRGSGASVADRFWKIRDYMIQAIAQIRVLSKGLYPVVLEEEGLVNALQHLAADVEMMFPVSCQFHCVTPVVVDNSTRALHYYRIAQEATRNAITHGGASSVIIELFSAGGVLQMRVVDDGTGFASRESQHREGIGLKIMRHRCNLLGLQLSLTRDANAKTVLQIGTGPIAGHGSWRTPIDHAPSSRSQDLRISETAIGSEWAPLAGKPRKPIKAPAAAMHA